MKNTYMPKISKSLFKALFKAAFATDDDNWLFKCIGANNAFSSIFDQMVNLVGETDALSAEAEKAEINFSLGNAESTHEVTVAQQKALVSLQYTVAVKNALMDAYREIMNIQI